MLSFLNPTFCENFENKLEHYHNLFPDNMLSGEHLETLFKQCFLKNTEIKHIEHKEGSHKKQDYIITTKDNINSKISIKSGTIKNNLLTFSSYRTTSYKTIEEKLNYIDKNHYDYQLNLAKKHPWKKTKEYVLMLFKEEQFKIKDLKFIESEKCWTGQNHNFVVKINKSQSDQLWYTVNLNNVKPLFLKIFNTPQHNLEWLSKST